MGGVQAIHNPHNPGRVLSFYIILRGRTIVGSKCLFSDTGSRQEVEFLKVFQCIKQEKSEKLYCFCNTVGHSTKIKRWEKMSLKP